MKISFMLLMVFISCLLHGYSLFIAIFLVILSIVWFVFFEYVRYVVQRAGKYSTPCRNNLRYMTFVFVFALINPALCLMLLFFFHPFYLSGCLRLNPRVKMIPEGRNNVNIYRHGNGSLFVSGDSGFRSVINVEDGNSSLYCSGIVTDSQNDISYDVNYAHYECDNHVFNNSVFDNWYSDTNPASGLPMIGGIDVCGDPYGINNHTGH